MSEQVEHAPPGPALATLGVVVHPHRDVGASIETILGWADEHGVRVVAAYDDQERVGSGVELVDVAELSRMVDGVIALGGDGTMLGAMRRMAGSTVPIMGVNHGHLGFLVEVDPEGLRPALDRLQNQDFKLQPHDAIQVRRSGGEPVLAFNDLVLARTTMVGATSLDLSVEGVPFGFYKADALVVATPTGSTAYSYAAGGPIVSPNSRATVVTPVAPMSGISRPMVLGSGDDLSISVASDSAPIAVLADGIEVGALNPGDVVSVETVPQAAQVVRLDAVAHTRRSHIKLSLLDLPLRSDDAAALFAERVRNPHRADSAFAGPGSATV